MKPIFSFAPPVLTDEEKRMKDVRATEKRVLHLRRPESGMFDEVIFVLNEDVRKKESHKDMLEEAARIVKGASDATERDKKKRSRLVPFMLGVASALAVCLLLALL